MKNFLFFAVLVLTGGFLQAQYCGNSGPSICTPVNIPYPGLYPLSDSLAPFINGQVASTIIEFKNFDTLSFAGQLVTIQSLTIDSINNLPTGLCWATNQSTNTYSNQESGCIKVSGTTCSAPGQYKLDIFVTVNIGFEVNTNADAAGLHYYVRVDNTGEAVTPVDTTQTSGNPFIAYGPSAVCQSLPLSVSLGSNELACNGSNVTLNPVVSNGQAPYSYLWQSTGNSLNCDTCPAASTTLTQTSTFIVIVTDVNDSIARDTVTYTVSGAGINFSIDSAGPATFCQGNSVVLKGASGAFTYQWLNSSASVGGATDSDYTATTGGAYQLSYVGAGGCMATSNTINVTVNQLPAVSLALGWNSICSKAAPVTLAGGSPGGGTYAGSGVTSGVFTPDSTLVGTDSITYTYTDGSGCTNMAAEPVRVNICTGISEPEMENSIFLYPNPVNELLTVESSLFAGQHIAPVLYDETGKMVPASFIIQSSKFLLNTSGLAAGVYWIRMSINGVVLSKKFEKIR